MSANVVNEHEAADLLFGESQFRDVKLHDPAADLTRPLAEIEKANSAWKDTLRCAELSVPDGERLTELTRKYLNAPPDTGTQAAWLKQASVDLASRYGADGARERLALTKLLIRSDARLFGTLKASGLLNHPRVISMLTEKAWSLRAQGRL